MYIVPVVVGLLARAHHTKKPNAPDVQPPDVMILLI